jgi:NAD(P)H dehydrogenase (quinone)
MILVTGATGQLGTAVVQNLLKKTPGNQIAALVRDKSKAADFKEQGVNIRVGNYDDPASLETSMQGIEKVLLIAGTDEANRVRQHQDVVNAAKKAGVNGIAYTSRTLKDTNTMTNKLMMGHFQTEDLLKDSGLAYAIFRNVLYMDAIPQFVGPNVLDTGVISLPTGQGRVAFALRSEMGEALANWLLEGQCDNQIHKFTADRSWSFADIATTLSTLSGKEIKYNAIGDSIFVDQLKARGTPEMMFARILGFLTDIKNGQEDEVSPDLERWLGRKPASLEVGLKALFKL